MKKAGRSPVRTRDGNLLLIDEGIRDVLEQCKKGSPLKPNDAVLKVKTWLDTWCSMSGLPAVDQGELEAEMQATAGMPAIVAWKANYRGPGEASAALIARFGGVGRTRLTELRAAVDDDDRVDLVRRRYRVGVRPDELKQFAMRLVGFSDAAVGAAMAAQPNPIEIDFFFGQWLG